MIRLNPEIAAKQLLVQFGKNGIFPVDPVVLAKQMGLRVMLSDLPPEVSGALVKRAGEEPVILLEERDGINRQRFSCAHELGHYVDRAESDVLDNEYSYIDYRNQKSSDGTDQAEIFANRFAASLLMPEDEVKRLHKKKASHLQMGYHFGVSADAIKFRLHNLGLMHKETA